MVMKAEVVSGVFALAGTLIGGVISYATARLDQRWERAKRHIAKLCDEVAAYHQLEKLYTITLEESGYNGKSKRAIMEEMRTKVAETDDFVRPTMTSLAAQKLRREWD